MANRPIFVDEILGDINGDFEPVYDTAYFLSTGKMRLVNAIDVEATPQNAGQMNNLFYFYNLIGVRNTTYLASGLGTGTITETIRDANTSNLIAVNLSVKSDNVWTVTETLYAGDGIAVLQERQIVYTKVNDTWEAVII